VHSDSHLTARLIRLERTPGLTLIGVVACLFAVLVLYWPTTVSMISIWYRSETFAHGFLVIPLFLFLVWRKRAELALVEPKPYLPALIGVAAAGFLWLLGELASAIVVSQLGMMLIVPFAIWAILGTQVIRTLAFPLVFLFFAVPFGEALVPKMMDWTADFTIRALVLSGVPVYREGNFFTIPSGRWSVVEACSGLRYLIASFVVGCLYAMLTYRSAVRRTVFILASIIVPIVANWLRAYGVVMLAHLTNNKLATGIDHVIYGWIFFGVVMLLLFWLGSFAREDAPAGSVPMDALRTRMPRSFDRRALWVASGITLFLAAIWQPLQSHLEASQHATGVQSLHVASSGGWQEVPDAISKWRPDISHASVQSMQTFRKNGMEVGLRIELFPKQSFGARAITSTNALVVTTTRQLRLVQLGDVDMPVGGRPFRVRSATITGEGDRLLAWHWYWIDGRSTTSDYAAKFYQVIGKLELRGDPTAWVIVYTKTDDRGVAGRQALQEFTQDMRSSIDEALARAVDE
jgi:exosortase A